MAFKGRQPPPIDFSTLLISLINSKLQETNFPLYQTIEQLINRTQQNKNQINQILSNFFGDIIVNENTDLTAILNAIANINDILNFATFWTENDESVELPSSRMAIAGTGITLDYSVANQVTISASGGTGGYYAPLTDGNIDETDLIFAAGECIMVAQP